MPLRAIEKVVEQGKVAKSEKGKHNRKQNCFSR